MEHQITTNGGLQYVSQIAVQYVYLDFDGELTSYNGELLTVDNVEVENPKLSAERIADIIAELNAKYSGLNVTFVDKRPLDVDYSTICIGKTSAFDPYGSFSGLAETIDIGNRNKKDKAFVLLDEFDSNDDIVNTISHETDHLLGILDHGGDGIASYAASKILVESGYVYEGKIDNNTSVRITDGGLGWNIDLFGELYVSSGARVNALNVNGGFARVSRGGVVELITPCWGQVRVYSGGSANISFNPFTACHVDVYDGAQVTWLPREANVYIGSYMYGYIWVKEDRVSDYEIDTQRAIVYTGGVLDNCSVTGSGTVSLYGFASDTTVTGDTDNGEIYVQAGGVASNTVVGSGGLVTVYDNGYAKNITVGSSGAVIVSSGGYAEDVLLYTSGSLLEVCDGAAVTITYNPWQAGTVESQAGAAVRYLDRDANVYLGKDNMFVSKQSTLRSSTLSQKESAIVYAGTADANTIDGVMILSGGVATGNTVRPAGRMLCSEGARANNTHLVSGFMYIYDGATAGDTYVSSGHVFISSGGTLEKCYVSDGNIYASGGRIKDINLSGFCRLNVSDGAVVDNVYLKTADTYNEWGMKVYSGGVVSNIDVFSHGAVDVYSGALVSSATLMNLNGYDKAFRVYSGGVVNNLSIYDGYDQTDIRSGAKIGTVTLMDNRFVINQGVEVDNAYVLSGGVLSVYGSADRVAIDADGAVVIGVNADIGNFEFHGNTILNGSKTVIGSDLVFKIHESSYNFFRCDTVINNSGELTVGNNMQLCGQTVSTEPYNNNDWYGVIHNTGVLNIGGSAKVTGNVLMSCVTLLGNDSGGVVNIESGVVLSGNSGGGLIKNLNSVTIGESATITDNFLGSKTAYGYTSYDPGIQNLGYMSIGSGAVISGNQGNLITNGGYGMVSENAKLQTGDNVSIIKNTNLSSRGLLALDSGSIIEFGNNFTFSENTGKMIIQSGWSDVELSFGSNAVFSSNTVFDPNGAACLMSFMKGQFSFGDNVLFEGNVGLGSESYYNQAGGGCIKQMGGNTVIGNNAVFSRNTIVADSFCRGGALYLYGNGTFDIGSNASFIANGAFGPLAMGGAICNFGTMTIGSGAVFSGNVASSGGAIYNANELVLSGADFLTVDDTVYNLGNIVLAGDVSFGGNVTFADSGSYAGTMKNNGNLDFYIVERGEDDGILISDWERISGGGSYSVTYDEKQAAGTYQLAANASDFDGYITIKSEDGTNQGRLTLDMKKALEVGNISFLLKLDEKTDILSVVVNSEYSKRADREKQETRAQLPDTAFSKLSYNNYTLTQAPDWLKIDPNTGKFSGTTGKITDTATGYGTTEVIITATSGGQVKDHTMDLVVVPEKIEGDTSLDGASTMTDALAEAISKSLEKDTTEIS
ncbi:MAG: hypothetical protein E7045_01290, partial [Lentisphaerae bacterium]|nr:hypothetical protein [Lentisphaerota bacterium]